jgi:hypothetical protein
VAARPQSVRDCDLRVQVPRRMPGGDQETNGRST